MKREEQDILQNEQLKSSPFCVPDNYISSLQEDLNKIPKKKSDNRASRWISYTAIAATFALLVLGGGMLLMKSDNTTPVGYAEAQEITDDDIIEYLIYSGVDLEDFEDIELY
jgi:hypothetical protein